MRFADPDRPYTDAIVAEIERKLAQATGKEASAGEQGFFSKYVRIHPCAVGSVWLSGRLPGQ